MTTAHDSDRARPEPAARSVLPVRPTDTVLSVLRNPRLLTREALAGVVTTLALVPEVISFSVIAGVDPMVSLVASIVLALVMSVLGGRPAMVTAAAGSVALVIAPLVREHGTDYVLPTVVLAGLVQLAFGLAGLARLMRFIPRSVMIGFVNALGVLIFVAQVPHIIDQPWVVYPLFALTIAIVVLLPKVTKAVPAPLVAIVVVTVIAVAARLDVHTVGDEGPMGGGLPGLTPWLAPFTLETLQIIWPTALSVAFVGLMETLLTAKLVDDLTETPSHKGKESWALGVANIAAGFYGGIAGCAMIGQTVVNVKIGRARTRVSTIAAGLFLLLLVTGLSAVMSTIPMVALAAVMMIVAITTVDWHSLKPSTLRRMPVPETLVMVVTVAVVVATNNLALGVAVGVLLAMVLFARRVAHVITVERHVTPAPAGAGVTSGTGTLGTASDTVDVTPSAGGAGAVVDGPPAPETVRYDVVGPLFFGSSNDLVEHFSYGDDPATVTVDLSRAQVWDASSVAALDSVDEKFRAHGVTATFVGLDDRSEAFHGRLTGRLG
ncbi:MULTISPECIES: SulP family inorganic anion transporter [unclassified Frigoribacterium]|uniref:SulP family inorganic anion transporter n=1 Tax=unclassified Frigoribacterium TaxID=2627005 RepID=UPI001565963C|nr:SulP family inorganic anion transporter [Frigoribacterium sp. VKM Ac-2860]NQX09744.1 SulP family inorganic anion transporter [Frigoribacterium sp. VKM Ac-2859]